MEAFKENLRGWASALKLKNMKFLIIATPVTNMAEAKERFGSMHGEIFDAMRDNDIYKFDFDATTVEAVIDTDKEVR